MSDRQPQGGGQQPPGSGPGQRRGLFARNPFLVIILILLFSLVFRPFGVRAPRHCEAKG